MTLPRARHTIALLIASTAVAATVTACSSGSSGSHGGSSHSASAGGSTAAVSGDAQNVTVHTTDGLRFSPDTIHAHVGTIRITLVNDGSYPHNLDVLKLHAKSDDVNGNPGSQQTVLTVVAKSPGTYQFVCTYHAGAGMRGELIVS